MKKGIFILLGALGLGMAASAQTEQGNFLVGGNLELNTAKKNTVINLTPSVGYFIVRNLATGVDINLGYESKGSSSNSTTNFDFGPFARYYFGASAFKPFLIGDLNFTSSKVKLASNTTTSTGVKYLLGAGLAAFINQNVAVEGIAGYSHAAYANQSGSGGFSLKFGFQVYINRAEVTSMTGK